MHGWIVSSEQWARPELIKVIMGTPTYSISTWMAKADPEILARPLSDGHVGYGMRQNMHGDADDYEADVDLPYTIGETELRQRVSKSFTRLIELGYSWGR